MVNLLEVLLLESSTTRKESLWGLFGVSRQCMSLLETMVPKVASFEWVLDQKKVQQQVWTAVYPVLLLGPCDRVILIVLEVCVVESGKAPLESQG